MSEAWTEKYRPQKYSEIQGNNKGIKKIKEWAEDYSKGDKPFLLYGDQGTGKTTLAQVVSKENDWPFEEINASSARKKEDIQKFASQIRNRPIDADYKLVLIDEADGFGKGSSLGPLKKVLDDSPNPVIITANEKWKVPDSIENKCRNQKFKLGKSSKKAAIRRINEQEDIGLSKREIGILATRDDLRSIINDLQRFSEGNEEIGWDDRDTEIGIFKAVENIRKGKKYTGETTPPELVQWLDENLSGRYEGVEGMRAYQALAHADLWLEKAQSRQQYKWWKHAGELAEQVANVRLSEPYDGWVNTNSPKAWRNSTPNPDGDSKEAVLYQELNRDELSYSMSTNFVQFKNDILPILQNHEEEKKFNLVLDNNLSSKAMKAIGITKSQYEDWLETDTDVDQESTDQTGLSSFGEEEEDDDEQVTSLLEL